MLIVVETSGVQETTEIVNLLLLNKKKSFNIYEDQSELLEKLNRSTSKEEPREEPKEDSGGNIEKPPPVADQNENVKTIEQEEYDNVDKPPVLEKQIPLEQRQGKEGPDDGDDDVGSKASAETFPISELSTISSTEANREVELINMAIRPPNRKLCWDFNFEYEPLPPDAVDDAQTFYWSDKSDGEEQDEIAEQTFHEQQQQQLNETNPNLMQVIKENKTCAKCKQIVKFTQSNKKPLENHALMHSEIMRFKCPIDGCTKQSRQKPTIVNHLQRIHSMDPKLIAIPDCLTEDEQVQLIHVVDQCFPPVSC